MSNLMGIAGQAEEDFSKEIYNLFNEEYKNNVEQLFENLHASELGKMPYKSENYKRVAFELGEQAEAFVSYMKKHNINAVSAPTRLNGQWLAEVSREINLADIKDITGTMPEDDALLELKEKMEKLGRTTISANELISAYHDETGEYTKEVESTDSAEDTLQDYRMEENSGQEIAGYFIGQMEGISEVYGIARRIRHYTEPFVRGNENRSEDELFRSTETVHSKLGAVSDEEVWNEQYRPRPHHGTKDKAVVLNNSIVVINGKVVTDPDIRSDILKRHRERMKNAEELAKNGGRMNRLAHTKEERRRIQNNANIIQSQVYQQEYTLHDSARKQGIIFKGGVMDRITEHYSMADVVRNLDSEYHIDKTTLPVLNRVQDIVKDKKLTAEQEKIFSDLHSKISLAKGTDVAVNLSVAERKVLDEVFTRAKYSVYTVKGSEEEAIKLMTYSLASGVSLEKSLSRLSDTEKKRIADSLERFSKTTKLSDIANTLTTAEKAAVLKFVTNPDSEFTASEEKNFRSALNKQMAEHTENRKFQNSLSSLVNMMKFNDEEAMMMKLGGMESLLKTVISYDKSQHSFDEDYQGMEISDISSGFLRTFKPSDVAAMGISEKEWHSLEAFLQNKESMMANLDNLKALEKDFGIKISADEPLTRERILEVNKQFLKKAEHTQSGKSYQFVTRNAVTGKYEFDVESLKKLTDEELKDIGISKASRDMLVSVNTDENWGFDLKQFSASVFKNFTNVFCKMTKNDEEMQQTMQDFRMMKKTVNYTKKSAAAVQRTVKAARLKYDSFRMNRAGGATGTGTGSGAMSGKKPPAPEGNAAAVRHKNAAYNDGYSAQLERKLERVKHDENGIIGKSSRFVENTKAKIETGVRTTAEKAGRYASSMLNKTKAGRAVLNTGKKAISATQTVTNAVNNVTATVKAAAGKYIAIGIAVVLLICIFEMIFMVVLMSIANLTEADYTEKTAFILYEMMKDKEDEWIENLSDSELTFRKRQEGFYGNTGAENYAGYISDVKNLTLGGTEDAPNEDELFINPFCNENDIVTPTNENKDLLTEVTKYDGKTTIGLSTNINIFSQRMEEENFDSGKSSIENGHTCNIKDILSMVDVMYQMNTGGISDAFLSDIMGITPSTLNWANGAENVITAFKWAKAKVKSWFGSDDEDPLANVSLSDALASDGTVSFKAVENYAVSLWESSHQEQSYYEVNFYTVLRDAENKPTDKYTMQNNGTSREVKLNQNEASELNLCVEPVTRELPIFWDGGNPNPCIITHDESGNEVKYGTAQPHCENNGFSVEVNMENLAEGENPCLWLGMENNEDVCRAIKGRADEISGDCWAKSGTESKDEDICGNVCESKTHTLTTGEDGIPDEAARFQAVEKALAERDAFLNGDGKESWELSEDRSKMTHIWYEEDTRYNSGTCYEPAPDGNYYVWDCNGVETGFTGEDDGHYYATARYRVVKHTEVYVRNCHKHKFQFCGGHVRLHNQGVVFSATNEQMAMTGIAEPSPVAVNTKDESGNAVPYDLGEAGYGTLRGKYILEDVEKDADEEVSFYEYASGGRNQVKDVRFDIQGSKITAGQGVNLWRDGTEWHDSSASNGISLDDVTATYWARDIFDIDCLLLKGKGIFPLRSFEDYTGWDTDNMQLALMKLSSEWTDMYGFDVPLEIGDKWEKEQTDRTQDDISTSGYTLNTSDIKTIMELVEKQYDLSERRTKAVKLALQWVGKGHYSEVHTAHDFLSSTCNGSYTVNRDELGAEEPEEGEADYTKMKGSCTASDNFGFINYVYNQATDFKYSFDFRPENYYQNLEADKTAGGRNNEAVQITSNGSTNNAVPADLFVKKKLIPANNLNIGDANWESDNAREVMMKYEKPEAVFYIGTFSDEILQEVGENYRDGYITLSGGQKIYAGVPVTIDLAQIHNIGNIWLHTKEPDDIMDLNGDTNYLWVMPSRQGYFNVHCYHDEKLDEALNTESSEEPTDSIFAE